MRGLLLLTTEQLNRVELEARRRWSDFSVNYVSDVADILDLAQVVLGDEEPRLRELAIHQVGGSFSSKFILTVKVNEALRLTTGELDLKNFQAFQSVVSQLATYRNGLYASLRDGLR